MTATEAGYGRPDIEVRNPADGGVVGRAPDEPPDAVAAKVRELRVAQPQWEAIGPDGRRKLLERFQDWVIG
jgi:acyl-CoA reductase-like NAD-dependent aldehyde dehydrogenase